MKAGTGCGRADAHRPIPVAGGRIGDSLSTNLILGRPHRMMKKPDAPDGGARAGSHDLAAVSPD
jgi:hypothetical protein